jgi:TfoX/Sxy family transcriptional regulator of competence genes
MSYDEELAARLRKILATRSLVTKKKMFGSLAFLVDGHMFAALSKRT